MTWWGRIKDLPQVEGCETPKTKRPKQGIKTLKNNRKKKERKAGENKKKPKKVAKGNPIGARSSGKSLDPRGGETAVQGRAPELGHQVNN
jgi:hypothetical protein